MGPRARLWRLGLLVGALLLGATPGNAAAAPPGITLKAVASGLPLPASITHAGDGSGRLFISGLRGQILVFDGTRVLPTPFLDISGQVGFIDGTRGFFSVAFHPRYASTGFFYVHYVNTAGHIIIARYRVSAGNPNVADPASALTLIDLPNPTTIHQGGQVQFGRDGFLYISIGDGGLPGDRTNNAQNLGVIHGKILRIDVDHGSPYAIPPSNPFVGTRGARGEIWAWGLRNPWRFTFDRQTGDMFIGDVGEVRREEVDFQPASSRGGENYGWRPMEGTLCFQPPTNCNNGTFKLPILEYAHVPLKGAELPAPHHLGHCEVGGRSINGGYRYRGRLFPALTGIYFFSDLCTGQIWGATPDAQGRWTATELLRVDFHSTSFGEDEGGELYINNHLDGIVYRIETPFAGGVFLAAADLDGAGGTEIVTGPGFGRGPLVRTFGTDNSDFGLSFLAYNARFTGGVRVAACDFDGDGAAEIVTGAGPGGGPHVQVFKRTPDGLAVLASFFPYTTTFRGGVYVACGDVDGDGVPDLITGADAGGWPHVRVFHLAPGSPGGVVPVREFLAFAQAFTGGVRVAAGNVDGSDRASIIVGAGPGGSPQVRVFKLAGDGLVNTANFFAYDSRFAGGVFVAAGDVTGDGVAEIVTGAGSGGGPNVRVFSGRGVANGVTFFAYPANFTGGVRVTVGGGRIFTGAGAGGLPQVRGFTGAGAALGTSFLAY